MTKIAKRNRFFGYPLVEVFKGKELKFTEPKNPLRMCCPFCGEPLVESEEKVPLETQSEKFNGEELITLKRVSTCVNSSCKLSEYFIWLSEGVEAGTAYFSNKYAYLLDFMTLRQLLIRYIDEPNDDLEIAIVGLGTKLEKDHGKFSILKALTLDLKDVDELKNWNTSAIPSHTFKSDREITRFGLVKTKILHPIFTLGLGRLAIQYDYDSDEFGNVTVRKRRYNLYRWCEYIQDYTVLKI